MTDQTPTPDSPDTPGSAESPQSPQSRESAESAETTDNPTHRPRAGRRVLAAGAAAALVVGVGGAGYAAGRTAPTATTTEATAPDSAASGSQVAPIPSWNGYGGGTYGSGTDSGTGTGSSSSSTDTSTAASGSQLTGLVRITTTLGYEDAKAAGTGMVLTANGEVVTNRHVVAGATSIRVTVMSTGKSYVARVIGTDSKDDVALLQLTGASGLTPIRADVDGLSVGDAVTNVGDANGSPQLSASTGTVLALERSITVSDEQTGADARLTGLVEVSSDVVPGDSGGATYDEEGEVVGMTTAATSGSPDIDGYAVPIGTVLEVVSDLQDNVRSSTYAYGYPAFLGIGLASTGTTVAGVYEGTAAARAGIEAGDQVTRIATSRVTTASALRLALDGYTPGQRVKVRWTDPTGTAHTATVTLSRGPVQ